MLESSFIFLNGIGPFIEKQIWDEGITHWNQFLQSKHLPVISPARKPLYDKEIEGIIQELSFGKWRTLAKRFKSKEHWRFLKAFQSRMVFLDIETTGEPAGIGDITMVGLLAKGNYTVLINGETLTEERLEHELSKYDLLVTFFGSGYDLPYLRKTYPRLPLNHAHFDVCFAARRLGLRGGLKKLERELGIDRNPTIQGLNGADAVHLWQEWQKGKEEAKIRLCEYNEADVRNLAVLADQIYETLYQKYGPPMKTQKT